jgi:hypothetical protein
MSFMQNKQTTLFTILKNSAVILICGSTLVACTNPSTPAGFEGYVYEQLRLLG